MAKGGTVDIGVREAQATATRRAKKAAKAAGAGKNKSQEEKRFSLSKDDRYIRPEASIETVSEMFPVLDVKQGSKSLFCVYAAKPQQVSKEKVCQFLDTEPLLCHEKVDEEWIKRYWPSVLETVKIMQPGDIQHWEREVQNPERIWKTTLYVKRVV